MNGLRRQIRAITRGGVFLRSNLVLPAGILCVSLLVASARGQTVFEDMPRLAGNPAGGKAAAEPSSLDKLLDMADKDVSQLSQVRVAGTTGSASLDMPVSSVSRQDSTVGRSPAAVFVITNEMIRRSGAKEIPELLRMVPGVDVARIDSNKWAVTVRGFNGRFANKLLVRIDGRDVYTPLFAGTFWDVQDVLLEDVERIEVIRGPGATVWGANAVNGVINIITRNAKNTQGVYLESGGGTYERGFTSARYGGQSGDDLSYRVYGKWFDRGDGFLPAGEPNDAWNQSRGGFRMDWSASAADTVTFQGDYYNGYCGDRFVTPQFTTFPYYSMNRDNTHVTGDNAVLNWKRVLDEDSDWTAKIYYDNTKRHFIPYSFNEDRDTLDIDFQYRFPVADRHELITGCEYRNTQDRIAGNPPIFFLTPSSQSIQLFSGFVQDEITLSEDQWYFTVGSKFEHNTYTGFEYQPTARLLWTPDKKHSLWGAVSRAVRTPSRGEEGCQLIQPPIGYTPKPIFPVIMGNTGLVSEELMAYEMGMRSQATEAFSWDLAVFYNKYSKLIAPVPVGWDEQTGAIFIPTLLMNEMRGDTYGFELAATYKINENWRLQPAYTLLVMNLRPVPGTPVAENYNGESPRNQFYIQSSWDLGRDWELDVTGRYVDSLASSGVPSYVVADARLAWRANKNLELSVVGRNLFNGNFAEYGNDYLIGTLRTEVQPEVYGQVVWRR
jgi:iron complex outermembrane recepter protein